MDGNIACHIGVADIKLDLTNYPVVTVQKLFDSAKGPEVTLCVVFSHKNNGAWESC